MTKPEILEEARGRYLIMLQSVLQQPRSDHDDAARVLLSFWEHLTKTILAVSIAAGHGGAPTAQLHDRLDELEGEAEAAARDLSSTVRL